MLLLVAISWAPIYAQNITVQGKITASEDGLPIPGVSVIVKGTSSGTISNFDGVYVIKAKKGETLVFSFIGMENQEQVVNSPQLNIKLVTESIGLDEVVAIGYGTVKKKELTGAVAQVKSDDITRVVTSDVGTALQGLVAGVNVTANSGAPGENSSILIRGVSSIDGNNTPLYVVDGVPQEGDPRLSTNEIETIDILKDAASCAIYGTRGAAGVILITTKQGTEGSLKVSVNGSYGIQDIRSGTPLMNASEQTYADFLTSRIVSGSNDDDMFLSTLRSAESFQNDTDLGSLVFIDYAPVQDYSVNISGGTKDISYNVIAGYYNKEGVIVNSNFERFNTRANTTYKHGKWRINASIGMTQEKTDRAPGGIITQTIKYHPTMEMIDPNSDSPIETSHSTESNRVNWVMDSFRNTDESNRVNAYGNFNINYEIIQGLNLSTRLGTNATNDYRHQFSPFQEVYDVDGELIGSKETNSSVTNTSSRRTALTWDANLTYRKKFNKVHNLTLMAAQSLEKFQFESHQSKKAAVFNNEIDVLDGAIANPSASSQGNDYVNKLIGTIGRVQYGYKSKYLFSASVRRDGSSRFSKENRWGVFPSTSAAWNISDESFWSGLKDVVNNMKLRGSYGAVGNQNFRNYAYSAGIEAGLDYSNADNIKYGAAQTSFANGDVKWETSIQSNIGIDLSFLKNKITFTAEYYNTNKRDMLMPITLPGSTGNIPNVNMSHDKVSVVYLNVGDMTNQGIELALGYRARTGKVNWRFNGTFSTNDNKVTKINGLGGFTLMDDSGLISGKKAVSQVTALAEGYEAGAFFIYETNGIVDTHAKLAEYQKVKPDANLGDLIYVDNNGDGEISDLDRVYMGSGLPKYEAGLNARADYKGFDFSMQWYSAIGHEIMNGAKATAYGWGRHADLIYQWSDNNPGSSIPSYRGEPDKHPNYAGYTDLWLEDGTFVRLKEITLGYTLPNSTTQKWGISKCRLYVTAQNPLTITGYTGYDPEVGGNVRSKGLDKGNYPVTALYTVGFNLNF
ncbi:SusC/RagA family TonB-linked outer membrane protein [Saccharicrinis aurantiacus]|uniref:SusC/RagA family TonB-linked outer membrane protein n=1 Tax=Saccharicrinis aurantiacus TaxID=1849719 RepID=UPI0024920AD8|nr:TonB-dependent receptor [Saccharicrinis aurantiacus]